MPSIKACIFDLDGVIVETNHYHFLAWKRLADELDIPFTEKDNEQLKGVSRVGSLAHILKLGDRELGEAEKERLMNQKNQWYLEYLEDLRPSDALPGVVDFLRSLKANGITSSIASSSKNARSIIAKLELDDLFDAHKDGNDVTIAKPNPDIFLKAAEALNEEPENCIVFEDALAGIEAAKRAGMRCVGVGDKTTLKDADYVISSFEELDLEKFSDLFHQKSTQI
ncbi:MAG: beta-phosphoglucomutase [Cyclobacteriaceae bacterium]